MRFRFWTNHLWRQLRYCNSLKYKTILIFSCLFILFAWFLHFPMGHDLDLQIMRAFHSVNSPFLINMFIPFVMWGSPQIAIPSFLIFSFWFYRKGDFQRAYLCLAALSAATALELILKKALFILPPPQEFLNRFPVKWSSISIKTQSSFPSGHTLRTTLFSALLLCWSDRVRRNPLFQIALVAIPVTTGFGMVHYGFHWLGDVIGGAWLALLSCAVSCRLLASKKLWESWHSQVLVIT